MATEVEGVLVTFRFVLILESIAAISAFILLFLFMGIELFLRIELLRLLGAALAHEHPLHLGDTVLFTMTQAV